MNEAIRTTEDALDMQAQLAPVMDGLGKIGKEVTERGTKMEARMAQLEKDGKRAVEDLEERTNKSVEDVLSRIEKVRAGSSLLNQALGVISQDDDAVLLSVVPQEVKERAFEYEQMAESMPEKSALRKVRTVMAVAEWFRMSTRLGCMRTFSATMQKDLETKEKLYAALQEKALGPNWEKITEAIQKAAYAEDAAGTGGNLVPTIVEADVIRLVKDAGDVFPIARQFTMRSKVHQVPAENTAVSVNWIDEAGTLTGGEGTFAQKTLTAEKIAGRATMSMEMIQDSSAGLLAYLLEVFSEKIAGELDYQMVLGDGSGPQFTGIVNGSGINVISTSATAAGRNLSYPLMVNVFVGGSEKSTRLNGYWFCSPKGYAAIIGLIDSTGQPIVQFGNVANAPNGTFLGRPIIVSARFGGATNLDDTTNTNTKVLFGPPSALLFGTRAGLTWDVTDQVNWAKHQVDARLIGRFAGTVGIGSAFSRLTKVNYT